MNYAVEDCVAILAKIKALDFEAEPLHQYLCQNLDSII